MAYGGRRDRLFYSEQLSTPNPACYVCRNVYITLPVDAQRATLGDLVDRIITPDVAAGGLGLGDEVTLMEANRWVVGGGSPLALELNQRLMDDAGCCTMQTGPIIRPRHWPHWD